MSAAGAAATAAAITAARCSLPVSLLWGKIWPAAQSPIPSRTIRKRRRACACRCRREEAGGASAAFPSAAPAVSTQPPSEELSFEELVALAQPSDLALDAYSARGLLNAAPRSASVLSSLRLAPDRFVQRYSVVAQSGGSFWLLPPIRLHSMPDIGQTHQYTRAGMPNSHHLGPVLLGAHPRHTWPAMQAMQLPPPYRSTTVPLLRTALLIVLPPQGRRWC